MLAFLALLGLPPRNRAHATCSASGDSLLLLLFFLPCGGVGVNC